MDIGGLEVGMVEEKDKKSAGVNIVNSDKRVGGGGDRGQDLFKRKRPSRKRTCI